MKPERLFLLDAMALIYRAHFAFAKSPRMTSTGLNTSAVFGFANTLLEILDKHKPTHIGVAFESQVATHREISYEAYKAQREETPEDIKVAVPLVQDLLRALRIPVLDSDGYEADDVIGTLAIQGAAAGMEVFMVTPDKDCAQIVRPGIWQLRPGSKFAPEEVLDTEGVVQKYGVRPDQIADLLGLRGDSADNIPGIPKVGEKTALELIQQFSSLEEVIARAEEIAKKSVRESVLEFAEQGRMSKELATIHTDVPVTLDKTDLLLGAPDKEALRTLCHKLEFRTLAKRMLGEELSPAAKPSAPDLFSAGTPAPVQKEPEIPGESPEENLYATLATTPHTYHIADTPEKQLALAEALGRQKAFCFDTETTSLDALSARIVGLSFSWEAGVAWYVPFPEDAATQAAIWARLRAPFENPAITKVGQNLKYDVAVLRTCAELAIQGPLFDTMLAHYVCHSHSRHGMDLLAAQYLNYSPVSIETLIGKKGKNQLNMRDVPVEQVAEYAAEDADITWQLYLKLKAEVEAEQLAPVLYDIELPLVPVLEQMERYGICLDVDFLRDYSKEIETELQSLEAQIYRLAGQTFNLNSPKQVGEVFFDKLQLAKPKKTRTGQYSTDEETLSALAAAGHEIPAKLLDYRELAKLKSTYVDALPTLVHADTGRVHTSYNQAVAITGRLSSNNPNLQNIPIRTARGREVRKAFVAPEPGWVLFSADYSQIELRIMAAMSQDPNLMEAFQLGKDIHTATAARVFGVNPEEVSREMRAKAKMVNFGIIYGITPFGLSQRLGISRTEAKEIIDSYFMQYPGVQAYMEQCVARAKTTGYAYTLMGRRQLLRDINSRNATVRSFAERNAINMPIQGSAADMIKLAMIRVHHALAASGLQARMLLQVHDELLFEAPLTEVEALRALVTSHMEQAMPLPGVPVLAETGTGPNWMDAH
ncbi:MAG: DNA polymerase I [Bacteroidetes bacterium]|nr:DNA polymerase I [Bacteroidota bacterium]